MNLDTEKLLTALKSSSDISVTLDKDFFISIVEMLDTANNLIKIEEVFNYNNKVIIENNRTIINGGVLLDNNSQYSKLTGEVVVEVIELKALMKENFRQREMLKQLSDLKKQSDLQVRKLNDRIIEEKRLIQSTSDKYNLYSNSLNKNIKVTFS